MYLTTFPFSHYKELFIHCTLTNAFNGMKMFNKAFAFVFKVFIYDSPMTLLFFCCLHEMAILIYFDIERSLYVD